MIYLERTVVIENSTAYIEEPIYLYKGDKNIEIRFAIQNNPFKYKNSLEYNYGQLIIKRDTAPNIFSEVTKLNGGRIILTITGEMIDELSELGSYTFQIRLYNEDQTSRGTLPPVENGIVIVEPLCEEPLEPPKVYLHPDFYEIRTNGGNYSYLFAHCNAKTLDLSSFDTSNVTNMSHMFYNCYSLTELDVSNFNTSNVTNMSWMFSSCEKLESLDVSNFNTIKVTDMDYMFYNCRMLKSLDLSNFDTSNVDNMTNMFNSCFKLASLDVSNWDTSKVNNISYMFGSCNVLTSLDLSNWDISKVTASYCASGAFSCPALTDFKAPKNINTTIDFSSCSNLTHDSLMSIINNLTTKTSTTKLTLGATNLAKLTDEEKAIATGKNWTLA